MFVVFMCTKLVFRHFSALFHYNCPVVKGILYMLESPGNVWSFKSNFNTVRYKSKNDGMQIQHSPSMQTKPFQVELFTVEK